MLPNLAPLRDSAARWALWESAGSSSKQRRSDGVSITEEPRAPRRTTLKRVHFCDSVDLLVFNLGSVQPIVKIPVQQAAEVRADSARIIAAIAAVQAAERAAKLAAEGAILDAETTELAADIPLEQLGLRTADVRPTALMEWRWTADVLVRPTALMELRPTAGVVTGHF